MMNNSLSIGPGSGPNPTNEKLHSLREETKANHPQGSIDLETYLFTGTSYDSELDLDSGAQ
jgi:hypothetical protein